MNIYDFDKTIYDGDSSIDFYKFCVKKNKLLILNSFKVLFYYFLYIFIMINSLRMEISLSNNRGIYMQR